MYFCTASRAHQKIIVLFTLQLLVCAIHYQGKSGQETVALAFCASYGHLHSNSIVIEDRLIDRLGIGFKFTYSAC